MEITELIKRDHKKKVKAGIAMGILCPIFCGLWYLFGNSSWNMGFLTELASGIQSAYPDMSIQTISILQAIFLCFINAFAITIMLFIWNGGFRKVRELKRTVVEFNSASKYFAMAAVCGGLGTLGTYISSQFISPGFASITGILYPIVGTILSVLFLKQKVSRKAYMGVSMMVLGGLVLYSGVIFTSNASISTIGMIGGLMTIVGWGIDGCLAGYGINVTDPDTALHLRFTFEALMWFIVLVVLAIIGFPMFCSAGFLLDWPTIVVMAMLGITMGWNYSTWYKSFPLIGVPRGQALGSLCGMYGVIFISIFAGPAIAMSYTDDTMVLIVSTTLLGMIISVLGIFVMSSEDSEAMVVIQNTGEEER